MPFDALGYAQKLQAIGVPQEQATAQAGYLRDAFLEQEHTLATKTDLAELRADFEGLRGELRTEFQSVRTEMATLRADLHGEMHAMDTRISRDMGDLKSAVGQVQGELQAIRRLFWAVVVAAFGLLFKEVITGTIANLAGS